MAVRTFRSPPLATVVARPVPSATHPAVGPTPSRRVLEETLHRLQSRGIRLLAHGVQSNPKRVWIRYDGGTSNLIWQTEVPRRIADSSGIVSTVMMRGAIHQIAIPNVVYVDVGKKNVRAYATSERRRIRRRLLLATDGERFTRLAGQFQARTRRTRLLSVVDSGPGTPQHELEDVVRELRRKHRRSTVIKATAASTITAAVRQ